MNSDCGNPRDGEKFAALSQLTVTLHHISDLDVMMETILTEARRFVRAEAGSIYTPEEGRLVIAYSQNDHFARLRPPHTPPPYKDQELSLAGNSLAGYVAREKVPLFIPDAYQIDPEKPYRFEPELDRRTGYITRSILTLPLTDQHQQLLGILQVINRLDGEGRPRPFSTEDEELMLIFSATASLALERGRIIRSMLLQQIRMVELRDPRETVPHALRVGALAAHLYLAWAKSRALDPAEVKRNQDLLRLAAMVHDLGKVGISDAILKKPGRLTPEEHQEMEKHVFLGLKLFEPVATPLESMIHDVILNHHERWDGRGYPGWIDPATGLPLSGHLGPGGRALGKKGEEISIFGRITAVADAFEALISPRAYKEAFDHDLVCQIMEQECGHHFDPELVALLLENQDQAKAIRQRYPDQG